MTAEQNYRLLQEIDANRRFLLQAYRDNADLRAQAGPDVKRLFDAAGSNAQTHRRTAIADSADSSSSPIA